MARRKNTKMVCPFCGVEYDVKMIFSADEGSCICKDCMTKGLEGLDKKQIDGGKR